MGGATFASFAHMRLISLRNGSLWVERSAWIAGITLLSMYGGMRLWAEESRANAVEEFRAASLPPADKSLWSQQRVDAYAQAQKSGDAPQALLRIPQLTLDVPVYADDSEVNLDRGAGHIPGTAALVQAGNIGIAAHRDGFFRKLKDVELGMDIYLEQGGRTLHYQIVEISIVEPEENAVLAPTDRPSVTLVTCYPFYFVGSAPKRFIVRGELEEKKTQTLINDQSNRNMQRRDT
jgi:sortase A